MTPTCPAPNATVKHTNLKAFDLVTHAVIVKCKACGFRKVLFNSHHADAMATRHNSGRAA